jgi:outer membrane murein-binding lipoprotein Lpp
MFENETSRFAIPAVIRTHRSLIAVAVALIAVLVYGVHEQRVAAHYSAQNQQASVQTQDLRSQVNALTAKLDELASKQTAPPQVPTVTVTRHVVLKPAASRQKPDPRWKKFQAQLDEQGKQIESNKQEIAGTRSDLEGSIARTHEELVVLQKKGERNYVEFDIDKSKHFQPTGPVGVSLRKSNVKHQYADLELLVDDRQISKKHLNLYEPAVFYLGERQPVELIVNSITKDHIRGYISAPKYRASELASSTAGDESKKERQKLEVPR